MKLEYGFEFLHFDLIYVHVFFISFASVYFILKFCAIISLLSLSEMRHFVNKTLLI